MHVLHVTTDTGETDIVRRELGAVDPDLRVECAGTPREAIERLEAETSPYDADLPPRVVPLVMRELDSFLGS